MTDTVGIASGVGRATVAGTLLPGFVGTAAPEWLLARLGDGLAGVCVFGANIASGEQLAALVASLRAANPATIVSVDEEGGDVTRLAYDRGADSPGNAILGVLDDLDVTQAWAARIGAELALVGVDLDFAPDVDVNANPLNPVIGVRSFGADPELVARHTAAWVRGLQSTGVAASLKHFPGHGDTAADSHLGLPVVDVDLETLRARDLPPFAAGIAAGAATVMTSHILLPRLDPSGPATFSARILGDLLRGELGFDGVIVSDALDMAGASKDIGIPEAAVRALAAGCDLLCLGPYTSEALLVEVEDAVLAAVADGRLPAARVADAAARVAALHEHVAPIPPEVLADDGPSSIDDVIATFTWRPGAVRPASVGAWVALQTEPSMAVGTVPWGPAAAGQPSALVLDEASADPSAALAALAARVDGTLVIVGRDLHRHPWIVALADGLAPSALRSRVLFVDMGWPDEALSIADVTTRGGSRLVGAALVRALGGATGVAAEVSA